MAELLYQNGISVLKNHKEIFRNNQKPYLSFDYDELLYTDTQKLYILQGKKYLLNRQQIDEIQGFISSLLSQKEKIKIYKVIESLQKYLDKTDYIVIRSIEKGEKIPQSIKERREDTRNKIKELRLYL